MTQFAELRVNLGTISSQRVGLSTIRALQTELWKLESLRKRWLNPRPAKPRPVIVEVSIPTEFRPISPGVGIQERPTVEVVYTRPRAPATVSSSASYNSERYLPYRILWAKVIVRAAYDYALWKDSKDMRLRKFAQDAEHWLFDPSDLDLSFENICFAYDFPVERIRRKTRTLTRDDVKKLEFRERQGRSEILGETADGNDK